MTEPNADKLKAFGVRIYVFAVGSYIDGIDELVRVAGRSSKPDEKKDYLFRLTNYNQFWNFSRLVVTKLESTGKYISLSPEPSPC